MHLRVFFVFRPEAVVRWPPPTSLMLTLQQLIGDLLRAEGVWEEGFLITFLLACLKIPAICGSPQFKWGDVKGWMHFFSQAPQLVEILHIFIRYNLCLVPQFSGGVCFNQGVPQTAKLLVM